MTETVRKPNEIRYYLTMLRERDVNYDGGYSDIWVCICIVLYSSALGEINITRARRRRCHGRRARHVIVVGRMASRTCCCVCAAPR